MADARDLREAREQGSFKATEDLVELEVDTSNPIDVFTVIEDAGIWLFFLPMGNALGAFLDRGAKGIMINIGRPLSVQRLTAAHEFGHFRLGHRTSVDPEETIQGAGNREAQEVAAQAYALDFIMPLELVERQWEILRLPAAKRDLTAREVYGLSLAIGISYRACIVQLSSMAKISKVQAVEFLKWRPKDLKRLMHGVGPANPWADVWALTKADSGRILSIRVDDEVSIELAEVPSTGFRWIVEGERFGADSYLKLVADEFEGTADRQPDLIGAGGHRYVAVRAIKEGQQVLTLRLARFWETTAPPSDSFQITCLVGPSPTGNQPMGLRPDRARSL